MIYEVQDKIAKLKKPKNMTVRPALIYEGKLTVGIEDEDYFDKCIKFADLLNQE